MDKQQHAILAQVQAGVLTAWKTVHLVLDLNLGVLTAGSRTVRVRGTDINHSRRGTTLVSKSKGCRCRLLTLRPASSTAQTSWKSFTAVLSLAAISPPGYRVLRRLGSGGSGHVYLASRDASSETVALKLVPRRLSADCDAERFMATAVPPHPRLVRTLDTFFTREHLVVVMEYASGGSLLDVAEAGDIPLPVVRRLAQQLLQAVDALHSVGIAHRDVKLENAVLDADGSLRLCDLGLAACEPPRGFSRPVGTAYTQAPEMKNSRYGRKVDLWSTGVVILVMLLRAVPFTNRNREALFSAMATREANGKDPLCALIGSRKRAQLPENMLNLLRGLLELDPAKRLDAREALKHPWFKEQGTPHILTVASVYMQLRRRVVSIRTKATVAQAKRRLLTAVRMVGFLSELWTKAGLSRSSFSSDSSSATRRLLAAQPLCVEA